MIGYAFRNRLWMIAVIAVAELAVLILWGVMKKVEKELSRR